VISFPEVVNSTAGSNESGCVPSSTTSEFDPEFEGELEETLFVIELVLVCVEDEVALVVELFPNEVAK